jgi:hypothetical protein
MTLGHPYFRRKPPFFRAFVGLHGKNIGFDADPQTNVVHVKSNKNVEKNLVGCMG